MNKIEAETGKQMEEINDIKENLKRALVALDRLQIVCALILWK